MSGDYLLFEKTLSGRSPNDKMFVRMTCQNESVLIAVTPVAMIISESFETLSPVCTITFVDSAGVLINNDKLDYENTFFLSVGHTLLDSTTTIPLALASLKMTNEFESIGRTDQIAYKATFYMDGWDSLLSVNKNRGWANATYSSIVGGIASEASYVKTEIEPSDVAIPQTVQPFFTDAQMINYIQARANSAQYDDTYEFGVRLDGTFIFKTVSMMVAEQANDAIQGNIPLLKLQGVEYSTVTREQNKQNNQNIEASFLVFGSSEKYANSVIAGAGGVKSMWYDFDTATYNNSVQQYEGMRSLMLSDHGSIKTTHTGAQKRLTGGRDKFTDERAKNHISDVMNSCNTFNTAVRGNFEYKIGQMVEVLLPSPDNAATKNMYSEMYSGFYIIGQVTHMFQFGVNTNTHQSDLMLMRQGFDGKGLSGYVKSTLGKFVRESNRDV